MSAPSDLCGSCNDTRANHEHHFESECQRFRERGDSGPCPWCERTDDHAHEFVDVLSAECDHELARLRAESVELRNELTSARIQIDGTETAPGLEHYRSEYESITEELSQWEWLNEDEGLSDSVAALCAARNELARELDACKTESAELRRQVEEANNKKRLGDQREASLLDDISELRNQLDDAARSAAKWAQRCHELDAEGAALKAASATGVRLVGPCPTIEAAPRLAVAELASDRAQVELTEASSGLTWAERDVVETCVTWQQSGDGNDETAMCMAVRELLALRAEAAGKVEA